MTSTDAPRCPSHGGPEWSACEKPMGHDGRCYAWLPGFGPVTWPNTGAGVRR